MSYIVTGVVETLTPEDINQTPHSHNGKGAIAIIKSSF